MFKPRSISTGGFATKKQVNDKPMMETADSDVKKSMKKVMTLGRKSRPKMPAFMSKAEGM